VLWRRTLVLGVLIDGGAHTVELFFERIFFSGAVFDIAARCEEQQAK
jgi:hypothetical protein